MISIVKNNRALLVDGNGDSSWSGATMQSYNTNAASWALASYLYKAGATYEMVPVGLAIGAGIVIAHRIVVIVSLFHVDEVWNKSENADVASVRLSSSFQRSRASPCTRSTCPS